MKNVFIHKLAIVITKLFGMLSIGLTITSALLVSQVSAAGKPALKPQVIKLERFRKALWKVHVTVKGKPGDFLLEVMDANDLAQDMAGVIEAERFIEVARDEITAGQCAIADGHIGGGLQNAGLRLQ